MRKLCVLLLLCAIMALGKANNETEATLDLNIKANSACPALWTEINGRCFHFDTQQRTWAQAQQNCQLMGGNLASVQTADEYNRVQQLTGPSMPKTWIGGSGCQEAGAWFWIDGKAMPYNFWCPAQPDNTLGECCLQMNTDGGHCWDDVKCSNFLPSVCVTALQ